MQTNGLVDDGCVVEFRSDSVLDEAATAKSGVPVFVDVPWVNIRIPGNKDEIIDTVAWLSTDADTPGEAPTHDRRFPQAWARFKANQSGAQGPGFQLKECPWILKSQVDHLAHFGIRTVEQLASVSDANCGNIIKGLELRTRAKAFLEEANSTVAMRSELEALKAQVAALTAPKVTVIPSSATEAFLNPQPAAPVADAVQPKRRGRPPKASTATAV